MKAVGYKRPLPISDPEALLDIELPIPEAKAKDLLVEVKAISVNPVDAKLRAAAGPLPGDVYRVLSYDAAGVVEAVGPEVTLFQSGDEVWYAGSIIRSGTNAQFHLVDERIVAHKPKSLDFTHAAALPLTGITAWELLFDRFGLQPGKSAGKGSLFIIGGAPAVLARSLPSLPTN